MIDCIIRMHYQSLHVLVGFLAYEINLVVVNMSLVCV